MKKIVATLVFILPMLVAFVLTNSFLFAHMLVPTASMVPSLPVGSHLVVFKPYYMFNDVSRGDMVAFVPPDDPVLNQDERIKNAYLTKRIIAVGGDKVEVKDNYLYLNDEKQSEEYINEQPNYEFGPVVVPEGKLLFLGDNRNNSYDSSKWVNPFVPVENLRGKIVSHFMAKEIFSSTKILLSVAIAFGTFILVYYLVNHLFLLILKKMALSSDFFDQVYKNQDDISYIALLAVLSLLFLAKDNIGRLLW